METMKKKVREKRRKVKWDIICYPSEASHCDMFYVYINGFFISSYLNRKDARKKIFNHITYYRYCEPEPTIKNVMYRSSNNSHNYIG